MKYNMSQYMCYLRSHLKYTKARFCNFLYFFLSFVYFFIYFSLFFYSCGWFVHCSIFNLYFKAYWPPIELFIKNQSGKVVFSFFKMKKKMAFIKVWYNWFFKFYFIISFFCFLKGDFSILLILHGCMSSVDSLIAT